MDDLRNDSGCSQGARVPIWVTLILWAAKRLPRGGFRIVSVLAGARKELQTYRISLSLVPHALFWGDLRLSIFYSLFKFGCYPHQLNEDLVARTILRKGDVVYDVGANIGYMTVVYADAVGSGGRVVAFEPSPACCVFLIKNTSYWSTATVIPKAVSDTVGSCMFEEHQCLDLSRVVFGAVQDPSNRVRRVAATTLDDVVSSGFPAPQFVKIDVEGHELNVFSGARQMLRRHCPVLMFEAFDSRALDACLAALKEIAPTEYQFRRVRSSGPLADVYATGSDMTSNYFAIPRWALGRFGALLNVD